MRRRKLLWKLYSSYLLIMLLSLVAVTWYASGALKEFYMRQIADELGEKARVIETLIGDRLASERYEEVEALCREMGASIAARITVILPSGRVVGDSDEKPRLMENHADRPEIQEAIIRGRGQSTRYSYTLKQRMMYLAVSVKRGDDVVGVVRTSMSVTALDRALRAIYGKIVLGGLVVALFVAAIGWGISRRINRPLEEMKEGAARFSQGDLKHRLGIPNSEEMGALAETMNDMAAQLDERIRSITEQRNELEAVLSSMMEAVLVVDMAERVARLNRAAERLFGAELDAARGRSVQEVVRNVDLHRVVVEALSSEEPVEDEIVLHNGQDRFLQASGTLLRDARGERVGALLVLNDVTRLRRLEGIRRDFVANVSHELRTPITSIKGFVETLKEGAIQDPKASERFLEIIARHSDRLNAILEDLLSLAQIEQEFGDEARVPLESSGVKRVLEDAILLCSSEAAERNVKIELVCSEKVTARLNTVLLEQAVVNLIDNAIKYSEPGGRVLVTGAQDEDDVVIRVQDWGCGISREHLDRIFERFYRVDKARSRELGGTGLGLAIVKHIVNAHGGRVEVESIPGKGSTFCVCLPAA